MADKIILSSDENPYASGQHPTWTDGLPHDFQGWGPKTPDPAEAQSPPTELKWAGEEDDHHNHYVWHFDGRRHRHH